MINISGYTVKEIQALTGASQQQVSAWARMPGHEWQVVATLGTAKVYSRMDVEAFLAARLRRDLMERAGWLDGRPGRGLIWYDDLDWECPKCGGFAIEKPARTPEEAQETPPIYCENCGREANEGGIMKYTIHFEAATGDYAEGFTISPSGPGGKKVEDYQTREGFFTIKSTCPCGGAYPYCHQCEEEGGLVIVAARLTEKDFKINYGDWVINDGWSNAT